jgi:SAM-dependent methyltransferase
MHLLQKVKRYFAIRFPLERNATKRIISFWEKDGVDFDYYKKAETAEWLNGFWNETSDFYQLFQQLDTEAVLEIACGTGRHSAQVVGKIKKLYLLDSSAEAMRLAKERFAAYSHVVYIHSPDGLGIPADTIPPASLTAVFSYDAMVHFEKEAVESYIRDSYRVLKTGGYALFHHSNYSKNPGGRFSGNPGWRNYMTQELFLSMAKAYGFEVAHSQVITYACPDSDCLTLLRKP